MCRALPSRLVSFSTCHINNRCCKVNLCTFIMPLGCLTPPLRKQARNVGERATSGSGSSAASAASTGWLSVCVTADGCVCFTLAAECNVLPLTSAVSIRKFAKQSTTWSCVHIHNWLIIDQICRPFMHCLKLTANVGFGTFRQNVYSRSAVFCTVDSHLTRPVF